MECQFLGGEACRAFSGAGGGGGSLGRGSRPGLPLTKRAAVGRTVDLDTAAGDHQVGGHLRAFVRLHRDVLAMLVERQRLQVAHPLTCQGRPVTRRLAEGRHATEAGAQARAGLGAGDRSALPPQEAQSGHLAPRDPMESKFQEAIWGSEAEFPKRFWEKLFEEDLNHASLNVHS